MRRNFLVPALICLVPLGLAAYIVTTAGLKFGRGEGGFRLGIDLAGGTTLVYQVDKDRTKLDRGEAVDVPMDKLAESLKRRLDPANTKNITIRPVGSDRIEIVLPAGASSGGREKRSLTQDEVERVKGLVAQVGSLKFTILANSKDDAEAFASAKDYFESVKADAEKRKDLEQRAKDGLPPPPPPGPFEEEVLGQVPRYTWVELGPLYRQENGLNNAAAGQKGNTVWNAAAEARKKGEAVELIRGLLYSRRAQNLKASEEDRAEKKFEYFLLTRASDTVKVGDKVTITANSDFDEKGDLVIRFRFNSVGASQFGAMTRRNKPDEGGGGKFTRQLAVVLDGMMITSPNLNAVIDQEGVIEGGRDGFTSEYVDRIVRILRAGALPATLRPQPVSQSVVGPTLGQDTIRSGAIAVAGSFAAVLLFMLFYYRFAGLVASIALLSNLMLTVAVMVLVDATFTLPGLAGLALTLGMAVDANILIYERIREERDRGNMLTAAIRNGYERAFNPIVDTHLSSIFTAVVLYVVGNDQLKGFGVSLTTGLLISLFTNLYLTRVIFDLAQSRRFLSQLRMLRLFSRTDINFMGIRYRFMAFTATVTLIGLGMFLARGKAGLDVDLLGGTVYGGKLSDAAGTDGMTIQQLRDLVAEGRQREALAGAEVEAVDEYTYKVSYGGEPAVVQLAERPDGETPEERAAGLRGRASLLRDASVEQVFASGQASIGGPSPRFTLRTTEPEPQLVKVMVSRLFRDGEKSLLVENEMLAPRREGDDWVLKFEKPVSPNYVSQLLRRAFRARLGELRDTRAEAVDVNREPFRLVPVESSQGEGDEKGQYGELRLESIYLPYSEARLGTMLFAGMLAAPPAGPAGLTAFGLVGPVESRDAVAQMNFGLVQHDDVLEILEGVRTTFNAQPQPDRLETIDAVLADRIQGQALYAILASWLAILLYLWFRFGNWTFGAAAVLCLVHDLAFTLGAIAVCHYVYDTAFGTALGLQDFKIDLSTVAALLTLVGYSVNDTIVVFDRIREVRGKNPELTAKMINDSVNQTLSRTILASVTTFLVVAVLYFFGGAGVHLFSFVMVIGVVVGTYSSIYVASPLLLIFGEGKEPPGGTTAVIPPSTGAKTAAVE